MTRFIPKITKSVVTAVLFAATLGAYSDESRTHTRKANAVKYQTGFIAVPTRNTAIVAVSSARSGKHGVRHDGRLPVARVVLRDAKGNVVARTVGKIGNRKPLVLQHVQGDLPTSEITLLSAEVVVEPVKPGLLPSCPLQIAWQTVDGNASAGGVEICGIDPCLDLQFFGGFPSGSIPNCPGTPAITDISGN